MFTLENFYQSKQWIRFRDILIAERIDDNGQIFCAKCGEPIYKRYDIIAHHIKPLTDENVNDFNISLNPDNVELIHFKCHNKEHQRYDGFRQYVYLVYGAPCSGKTTYVQQNAFDDDLILDLDCIWESICKQDRYHKPNRLKPVVFAIRDTILQQIKTRSGMWRNAYIIGGYPLRSDRDRLCELLRATPIYIEASKDECLARAQSDEWKEFVEDWFDSYTA